MIICYASLTFPLIKWYLGLSNNKNIDIINVIKAGTDAQHNTALQLPVTKLGINIKVSKQTVNLDLTNILLSCCIKESYCY